MAATSPAHHRPDLDPGRHYCCVLTSDEEHRDVLTPLLCEGLSRRETVLYFTGAHAPDAMLAHLRDAGVDVASVLSSGQLRLVRGVELRQHDGTLDPDRVLALLASETERALEAGWSALRATCEMTWQLGNRDAFERLLVCETKLTEFLADRRCLVLCQHDGRRLPLATLATILDAHEGAFLGARFVPNSGSHSLQTAPSHAALGPLDLWAQPLLCWLSERGTRPGGGERFPSVTDLSEESHSPTEAELLNLNRLLRAIRSCNREALRAADENALLTNVCRIACEEAGYRAAWVGYAENGVDKRVRPVAWAGSESGFLAKAQLTWADEERGRSATGAAIRTGRLVYIEDLESDPRTKPWREDALQRGYRCSVGLPIRDERSLVLGALTIYAATPSAFTANELQLLEQLASDLTVGLSATRDRAARTRAEQALRASERLLSEAQRDGRLGSWDWDATTDTMTWSEEYYRIFGLDRTQSPPGYAEHLKAYTPESAARLEAAVKRNLETGEPFELDLELASRDGSTRWITTRSKTKRDTDGQVIGLRGTIQDITERKRTEEELRRSEQKFSAAFYASPDLMAVTRLADGTILEVNDAYTRILGYSREESLGRRTDELSIWADPADRARFVTTLQEHGQINDFETTLRRKDGSLVACLDSARTIEFGGEACVLSVAHDISERKRAEEERTEAEAALRVSEERYRTLFENSPAGIYRSTLGGRILHANKAFAELLGYRSVEDLLQESAADLYRIPGHREHFIARLEAEGMVRNFESELRREDGTSAWALESATLVSENSSDERLIEGALIDVSKLKRLEEETRRSAAAIEQTAETIVITDIDGTIQYVNPAFTRSTGYDRDEVIGRNPRILKSGKHSREFYREMWEALLRGDVWRGHLINRRKDGSQLEEDAAISPVRDESGRIAHFVGVKRDVTQELELEARLQQAQKLEAVGRLAGGIAHDFNNLLQTMLARTQMLRGDSRDLEDGLSELEAHIQRGAALARQLLLFSRHEPVRQERLDLGEMIDKAAKWLRRLVRENIGFSVTRPDRDALVDADRGQLEQVLMNLVINAVDAMPDGGRLCIRAGADDERAWFEVEDSGCGIPDAVREKVFEPFFTTKPAGHGTGLGLSVVHGIVSRHGGTVDLATTEGVGSRFRVCLPARAPGGHQTLPTPTDEERPVGRGERVLIVEDEPKACEMLRKIVDSLGYEATAVGTGEEASRLAEAPPFSLLLTDLMLPDTDGATLARNLRDRWTSLSVILMSGYGADDLVQRADALDHNAFLQKPFDVGTLARALRSALDGRGGA